MTRPECADTPDVWFTGGVVAEEIAKRICDRCELRNWCAERGRDEPAGVWGGLDAGDRLALQLLATPLPEPEEIHDRARYVRDGCRCGDCRRSNAEYVASWRDRVTEQRTVSPMADQLTFAGMS